ncbi:HIRAN domain-containing protein [Demequina muriae]|uniref:HIRAN domain-containing protein n=1 Tax=Demequina muriae TaxID=3051664 RepID=A0ABT8GF63_9MICO|nr:HIRAN domain-containing protein [Demequina sp. EGI L300058]MDN4479914.1 HIRAN domain-containing protein [Demequina sp. EGI L300058]
MGILDRWRRKAREPLPLPQSTVTTGKASPDWRDAVRRYRDPSHPERPPNPKKVARSIHSSKTLTPDRATVERECEIAGIPSAAVYAELDAIRAREAGAERDRRSGWRERTRTLDIDPERVVDLRPLGGTPWKVVGAGHWLSDRERDLLRPGWFVLHREPENPYDSDAVAVYLDCRKIGYLTKAKAKAHSPILATFPADGFEVDATISGRNVLVTLPQPSVLRRFANRAVA